MLISGLTQAQEFDFSCEPDEEFTYTYNIEIGSGDHIHTLTASKTVTTNDIFELEYAIPNGYAITSGTGAQIAFVGSDWSVKRGAIVVGADSFKVSVKPPSTLINGEKTVNFGTWITVEEVDFSLVFKFDEIDGESITTVVSQTIIGLNPGSIVLQAAIKDGYYITSNYEQDPYDFAGYNIAIEKFEEEQSHFNTTVGLPTDLDYSSDITIQIDLSNYVEAESAYGEYVATINGEAFDVIEGEPETFIMTDGVEVYEGAMKIVVEGPNFPSKTFVIDYPGSTPAYLEGTPFHIQIPLKCCNSDFEPSNYQQWLLKLIVNDNPLSDYEAGDWSATYSKAVPGVDFSIDSNSTELPANNDKQVVITWNFPGEEPAYQTVDVSTGDENLTFKGSFELPEGITTKDIEPSLFYFNSAGGKYVLGLEGANSEFTGKNVEWALLTNGNTSSADINVVIDPIIHWEWFNGYEDTYEILPDTNGDGTTQFHVTWLYNSETVTSTIDFVAGPLQHDLGSVNVGEGEFETQDLINYEIQIQTGATLHLDAKAGSSDFSAHLIIDETYDTSGSKDIFFTFDLNSVIFPYEE